VADFTIYELEYDVLSEIEILKMEYSQGQFSGQRLANVLFDLIKRKEFF